MIGGAQGYAVAVAEFVGGGPQQLDRRAPEELSEQDVERLDFLIKEAVRLTQGIALRKSSSFLQFQNTNMETMVEEKALRPHWRSCLVILLALFLSLHTCHEESRHCYGPHKGDGMRDLSLIYFLS